MKTQLILFGVLSLVTYLVWLGWNYLQALSSAFGNANPSQGPGDVGWVFIVLAIVTVGCVVAAFFVPAGAARYVSLAPVALVLLGQCFIMFQEAMNRRAYFRRQDARRAVNEQKLTRFSQDFILKAEAREVDDPYKASFLTYDRQHGVLVRIDVGYNSEISAFPFGRIEGDLLETVQEIRRDSMFFRSYVDAEGKSVFDRYRVKLREDQDLEAYHLEQYKR